MNQEEQPHSLDGLVNWIAGVATKFGFNGGRLEWKWQRRKRRLTELSLRLWSRRLTSLPFQAWKAEAHSGYREKQCDLYRSQAAANLAEATSEVNAEIQMLRQMVMDLTQDLHNETALKEHVKQQYDQALLHGMSALNHESTHIHQSVADQSQAFSEASKLVYSPQRMSPFR